MIWALPGYRRTRHGTARRRSGRLLNRGIGAVGGYVDVVDRAHAEAAGRQ